MSILSISIYNLTSNSEKGDNSLYIFIYVATKHEFCRNYDP
jgi:hypothetical protein